jgi:hypothetical protein
MSFRTVGQDNLIRYTKYGVFHFCYLVVRVFGHTSRCLGSIPRGTKFFWEVVGLERGPLSLVGSDLENRECSRRDPSRWPRDTLQPKKLALTSPTSGGRSVRIVRSRTKATEFFMAYFTRTCGWGERQSRVLWFGRREEARNIPRKQVQQFRTVVWSACNVITFDLAANSSAKHYSNVEMSDHYRTERRTFWILNFTAAILLTLV